jgi:branched-chain amino acid transport system permease protein
MTSLSVSAGPIAVGVWAAGTFSAGLAVLAAPVLNVSSVSNYTVITASAFVAVVAAAAQPAAGGGHRADHGWPDRSCNGRRPVSSQVTGDIIAAIPWRWWRIPLYYTWRKTVTEENPGGTLDRAIDVRVVSSWAQARPSAGPDAEGRLRGLAARALRLATQNPFVLIAAILPLVLSAYWVGPVAEGVALAIIFLSFTLLTGEGGMISCARSPLPG